MDTPPHCSSVLLLALIPDCSRSLAILMNPRIERCETGYLPHTFGNTGMLGRGESMEFTCKASSQCASFITITFVMTDTSITSHTGFVSSFITALSYIKAVQQI